MISPTFEAREPRRATGYEIHPVYAVDVCTKSSLGKCKAEDETVWVRLHEWDQLEEPDNE